MSKLIIPKPRLVEFNGDHFAVECDTGKVSDGYHTFDELYDHRCLLFLALQDAWCNQVLYGEPCDCTWKSRRHHDGTAFDGWFIAGLTLPQGQITYHISEKYWDLCKAAERDTAPEWDGHTAQDVIDRLQSLLR
jgi:hypothetical protein